jgi:hypothetical protein
VSRRQKCAEEVSFKLPLAFVSRRQARQVYYNDVLLVTTATMSRSPAGETGVLYWCAVNTEFHNITCTRRICVVLFVPQCLQGTVAARMTFRETRHLDF